MQYNFNNKCQVIVFEGIDGSGKSSIASLVYKRLQGKGFRVALVATRGAVDGTLVRPRQERSYAAEALSRLAHLVWPPDGAEQHHEVGYGYWLGLAAAYFQGLEQAILPDLRQRYDLVLVEDWCFKFAAKLMLKGYDPAALKQVLPFEACLDAVVLVDTPPEQAWLRKGRFSFVELGGQDGYEVPGRDSFIDYQSRVRSRLLELAAENWTRVENDASSLDEVCSRVEALLLHRLAAPPTVAAHD